MLKPICFLMMVASVCSARPIPVYDFGVMEVASVNKKVVDVVAAGIPPSSEQRVDLKWGRQFRIEHENCSENRTCHIQVSFRPTTVGPETDNLTIKDKNGVLLASVGLRGVGLGPQMTFFSPSTIVDTPTEQSSPSVIVSDLSGHLYVLDSLNLVLNVMVADSGILRTIQQIDLSQFKEPLSDYPGLAVDSRGNIFISGSQKLLKIQAESNRLSEVTYLPTSIVPCPGKLAVDVNNTLFIVDKCRETVTARFANGKTTVIVGEGSQASLDDPLGFGVSGTSSLTVGPRGDLVLADPDRRSMRVYNKRSGTLKNLTANLDIANRVVAKTVCVDAGGNVLFIDSLTHDLSEIDTQGHFVTLVSGIDGGVESMLLDSQGNLYVARTSRHQISMIGRGLHSDDEIRSAFTRDPKGRAFNSGNLSTTFSSTHPATRLTALSALHISTGALQVSPGGQSQTVTLENVNSQALSLRAFEIIGDEYGLVKLSTNCGHTLLGFSSCSVSVGIESAPSKNFSGQLVVHSDTVYLLPINIAAVALTP
jgi:hypothetical protein